MKKFTIFLLLIMLMATSCDSFWNHESGKGVNISLTIPNEMIEPFVQENKSAQRALSGGISRAGSSVDTSILATVSIINFDDNVVLAEQSVSIGETINDTITFEKLYIVGSTVYARVELSRYGYVSKSHNSDPITVIEGYNEILFEFGYLSKVTWKLSFDTNGGSNVVPQQSVLHLEKATLPSESADMVVPSGKEFFLGWTKTPNGNDWVVFPYEVTESDTLYARWANPGEYTELIIINNGQDELSVNDGTSATGEVKIPPMKNGKPITLIGDNAFFENENITSVIIPEGVTIIGHGSGEAPFGGCTNLTSVILPESLTAIYGAAFNGTAIENITIPAKVTTIDDGVFAGCRSVTSITVSSANANYRDIDGSLYTKNGTKLLQYALGKADTHFTIPSSVTIIGDSSFFQSSNLTNVIISSGVRTIEELAFGDSEKLQTVSIPNTVRTIERAAFQDCTALKTIEIPKGITRIESSVLSGCTSLTSVTIPSTVTEIGSSAFNNCKSLLSVTIPNGVKTIDGNAFRNCTGLTSITIPASVETIFNYAFLDCNNVTDITVQGKTSVPSWDSVNSTGWHPDWDAKTMFGLDVASRHTVNWDSP